MGPAAARGRRRGVGGLRPAPCAQPPRPAPPRPTPNPPAAHLAAAGAAGHVGAGHDVQLRGAVRGVGADTVLALGVHWRAGLGAPGGAREGGGRPRGTPASAPLTRPRFRPHAAPRSPGIRHFHEHTRPWALAGKKRERVSRTARDGSGTEATDQEHHQRPQRGATSPQHRPPASSRHSPTPPPPSDRPGSGRPSCPAPWPLTTRVEGAAPPGQHLALQVEPQGTHGGLLLAEAGIALWRDRGGHGEDEGAARGPGPHGVPAAHWPRHPLSAGHRPPRPQQPLRLPGSGRRSERAQRSSLRDPGARHGSLPPGAAYCRR